MNEERIEQVLRRAPAPPPPADLLEQLQAGISLPGQTQPLRRRPSASSWFRAWLPDLGFATGLLLGVGLLAYQGTQLAELRRENQRLQEQVADLESLRRENAARAGLPTAAEEQQRVERDREELLQLRAEITRLQATLAAAKPVTPGAGSRPAAPADATAGGAQPETDDEFFARVGDPRSNAQSISCINNLKQIGLAARIYGNDNQDVFPASWLAMTNELHSPKILVCPADRSRQPAANWASFTEANVSYDLLNAGGDYKDPNIVLARCPVHQHVCLSDGSVQNGAANGKSFTLTQENGKTVFRRIDAHAGAPVSGEEALRKRYGLPDPNP